MLRSRLATVLLTAFVAVPGLAADLGPRAADGELQKLLTAAGESHRAGRLLDTQRSLQEALDLVRTELRVALLEVLPRGPVGFERLDMEPPARPMAESAAAPLMQASTRPIEQAWRAFEGNGFIRATILPNAPTAQLVLRQLADTERVEHRHLLEWETRVGLIEESRHGLRVAVVFDERHVLEIRARGVVAEDLVTMFDDRVLDRLAGALGAN